MKRETIEWCQFYWYDTEKTCLPRILLIGDSIVVGHAREVAHRMEGFATVGFYATSKIAGDPAIFRELALALADEPVDLVCFNNGLHGLDCSDTFYRDGLTLFTDTLRHSTSAMLVWRTSTPITEQGNPARLDAEKNDIVLRRNTIASEIMAERNIPVLDLYTPMLGHPELRRPDGFHYLEAGVNLQAEIVSAYLKDLLPLRNLSLSVKRKFATDFPGRFLTGMGSNAMTLRSMVNPVFWSSPMADPRKGSPGFGEQDFSAHFPKPIWNCCTMAGMLHISGWMNCMDLRNPIAALIFCMTSWWKWDLLRAVLLPDSVAVLWMQSAGLLKIQKRPLVFIWIILYVILKAGPSKRQSRSGSTVSRHMDLQRRKLLNGTAIRSIVWLRWPIRMFRC